ncbi:hypothetical protein INS49_013345 [Diaporthe citri]|uniref:uncharacterized protein n=1 Tax=Diaporthe citri TaxID=83186 RepID=UPI001C813009|nr:uncharacterized protein INS49_013345 [Diaporthe citri]KAG6357468.1 hypothetical protein INS49_013345 [Diaporthe citri]
MAYNREMNSLKDMKDAPYLSLLMRLHRAIVLIQVSWRFPLISPLKYLYLVPMMMGHSHIREHSRQQLERRIRRQGAVEHLDFIEQLIPEDREPPKGKELRHLEQVAGQLLIAGYEPPSLWFYFTIYHLVQNRGALDILTREIRDAFETYDGITAGAAANLPYLTCCLKESLRFTPPLLTGMPVISPGATVDGTYVPRGVVCQSSLLTLARSPRNFHEPLQFRPERWITADDNHPLSDPQFADDNRAGFQPFSQGPRICAGREIAWWPIRVFIAKVLWKFDLEIVPGSIGAEGIDGVLRGWAMYEKPEVRL